jgi:hypothetical protein
MEAITNFSSNSFDEPISKFELDKLFIKKTKLNVYYRISSQTLLLNKKKFIVCLNFEEPNWYWWGLRKIHRILNIHPINYPRNFENNFDKVLMI